MTRRLKWRALLAVCLPVGITGCYCPSAVTGRLLSPPPLSREAARAVAERAPVPAEEDGQLAWPAAVRAFPTNEVVVDIAWVGSGVEPSWKAHAGKAVPESESVFAARFMTNGLNVPARLTSDRRESAALVFRVDGGPEIKGTRAVLGHPPFEENLAYLHASDHFLKNVRTMDITRAGRPYRVCLVPVLLAIDEPLRPGEKIDVRIKPKRGTHPFGIDDRWHRLRVEAFVPTQEEGS